MYMIIMYMIIIRRHSYILNEPLAQARDQSMTKSTNLESEFIQAV
jgi:hypothetical protein